MKPSPDICWQAKTFDDLSTLELFEILKLRQSVFVVEQACAYPDIDDADQQAIHFCGTIDSTLAAYVRILGSEVTNGHPSIGRVAVDPTYRSLGLGRRLMAASIKELQSRFPGETIKISAQSHLQKFYTELGFSVTSDEYLEDGIPHIDMLFTMTE